MPEHSEFFTHDCLGCLPCPPWEIALYYLLLSVVSVVYRIPLTIKSLDVDVYQMDDKTLLS